MTMKCGWSCLVKKSVTKGSAFITSGPQIFASKKKIGLLNKEVRA